MATVGVVYQTVVPNWCESCGIPNKVPYKWGDQASWTIVHNTRRFLCDGCRIFIALGGE